MWYYNGIVVGKTRKNRKNLRMIEKKTNAALFTASLVLPRTWISNAEALIRLYEASFLWFNRRKYTRNRLGDCSARSQQRIGNKYYDNIAM